jgi:hypothetical protein
MVTAVAVFVLAKAGQLTISDAQYQNHLKHPPNIKSIDMMNPNVATKG